MYSPSSRCDDSGAYVKCELKLSLRGRPRPRLTPDLSPKDAIHETNTDKYCVIINIPSSALGSRIFLGLPRPRFTSGDGWIILLEPFDVTELGRSVVSTSTYSLSGELLREG